MKTPLAAVPRQWAWHDRALVRLGHTLAGESGARSAALRETVEHGGNDRADAANDESAHESLLAEIRQEQAELTEIEAALERIRQGTYGVCELTGAPIEAERLRAVPWARCSLAAAKQLERTAKPRLFR